jgi:hypothetical protein
MGCGSSAPAAPPPSEALSPPMGLPLDKRKHLAGRAGVCLAWGGRVEWGGRAPWASGRRDKRNVRVGPPPALGLCLFVSSVKWEILGLQLFVSTYPMQIFYASCVRACAGVCGREGAGRCLPIAWLSCLWTFRSRCCLGGVLLFCSACLWITLPAVLGLLAPPVWGLALPMPTNPVLNRCCETSWHRGHVSPAAPGAPRRGAPDTATPF